jgi:CRP/FNR family transcriptional regulator, cyclic AMP receptor protein
MTTKSTQSILHRFRGRSGRQHLVDAICCQPIVAGNRNIARELARAGELSDVRPGKTIVTQGNCDNDLRLLLCGEVTISVNGRVVANRSSGTHVGEMALLDPTARRSATVTTVEHCTFLKVSEPQVSRIAARYPDLWRRVAVELASRLRERSKFLLEPHAEPVIFIGSSSEALQEADYILASLRRHPAVPKLWTQGVFQLSHTTIEDLWSLCSESDFAVIILTPDDMTFSRGRRTPSPRDNAVFELGLFMGALGKERTIIVTPRGVDIKIPSDLLGITRLQYKPGGKKTLARRLQPVARTLWKAIIQIAPK